MAGIRQDAAASAGEYLRHLRRLHLTAGARGPRGATRKGAEARHLRSAPSRSHRRHRRPRRWLGGIRSRRARSRWNEAASVLRRLSGEERRKCMAQVHPRSGGTLCPGRHPDQSSLLPSRAPRRRSSSCRICRGRDAKARPAGGRIFHTAHRPRPLHRGPRLLRSGLALPLFGSPRYGWRMPPILRRSTPPA